MSVLTHPQFLGYVCTAAQSAPGRRPGSSQNTTDPWHRAHTLLSSAPGAPVGNAVAAGVGVGIYKNYDMVWDWVELGERSIPNPENTARYRKLYEIHRDLYPALKEY